MTRLRIAICVSCSLFWAATAFTPSGGFFQRKSLSSSHSYPFLQVATDAEDLTATGVGDALFPEQLNIIYDSKCSVCRWEVDFLRSRMEDLAKRRGAVGPDLFRFTDLESADGYKADDPRNGGVSYEDGMRTFMAVRPDGSKVHGVQVFREAYDIADLGWVFAVTRTPIVGKMADAAYKIFAQFRTDLTRGAPVDDIIRRYYEQKRDFQGDGGECVPCKEKSLNN